MKLSDFALNIIDGFDLLWKNRPFLSGIASGLALGLSCWGLVAADFWMIGAGAVVVVASCAFAYRTGKPK